MTSFDFDEGWNKLEKDEQENIIYCSPRFAMYKQSMGRFKIPTLDDIYGKPPALNNEDRFIQHVIKEYEKKGRI